MSADPLAGRRPSVTRAFRLAVIGVLVAIALSSPALSAVPRPSERACLIAWNAPANASNRAAVAAGLPWPNATLHPGRTFQDTWTRGGTQRQTSDDSCLMTLGKRRTLQLVTGLWRNGRVREWSFGQTFATSRQPPSNVRVLPDGRVTKVYIR